VIDAAPLGAGAIALVGSGDSNYMVAYDGPASWSKQFSYLTPRTLSRFADVDGDGRADLLLREERSPGDFVTIVVEGPRTVDGSDVDWARSLVAQRAPTLPAAVKAAQTIANRAVVKEDVCAMLAKGNTLAGFRAIAATGAWEVDYSEPGQPTLGALVTPLASLTEDKVSNVGEGCPWLDCDGANPWCVMTDGPSADFYVFTWESGSAKPKLLVSTRYTGS
jgi:hypothetical protein